MNKTKTGDTDRSMQPEGTCRTESLVQDRKGAGQDKACRPKRTGRHGHGRAAAIETSRMQVMWW